MVRKKRTISVWILRIMFVSQSQNPS
jgi:hypothetical protein